MGKTAPMTLAGWFLIIVLFAGLLVGWLANVFAVHIPHVVTQLYIVVVICMMIFVIFEHIHVAQ